VIVNNSTDITKRTITSTSNY